MNLLKKHLKTFLSAALLAVLILGNPSERRFLKALQQDYGSIHAGMEMSTQDLKALGQSSHRSYLLWSFYDYSFGTIEVNYVGIAFMTFYLGSSTSDHPQIQPKAPMT